MNNNPKRTHDLSAYPQNDWYTYYAGYSDRFVLECLELYSKDPGESGVVLDPWNGTGTTTLCAAAKGKKSIGIDVNPVMHIIAMSKFCSLQQIDRIMGEIHYFQNHDINAEIKVSNTDPLNKWFTKSTVCCIRKMEYLLCDHENGDNSLFVPFCKKSIDRVTIESAYVYLCFFLILRKHSSTFLSSNPTWMKSYVEKKITIKANELLDDFLEITSSHRNATNVENYILPNLKIGSSCSLSTVENESIDIVVSSPPYCTRLDYVIYTQLELAMLGYDEKSIKQLRMKMIGSPTIHHVSLQSLTDSFPLYCKKKLAKIETHGSKAAKSYYYKTYKQYFVEIFASINEIYRVLARNGYAILVVQDSWFKDIHIDVAKAIMDYAISLGMEATREDNPVKNNMVYINSKSRKYKTDKTAVESIITLFKY